MDYWIRFSRELNKAEHASPRPREIEKPDLLHSPASSRPSLAANEAKKSAALAGHAGLVRVYGEHRLHAGSFPSKRQANLLGRLNRFQQICRRSERPHVSYCTNLIKCVCITQIVATLRSLRFVHSAPPCRPRDLFSACGAAMTFTPPE